MAGTRKRGAVTIAIAVAIDEHHSNAKRRRGNALEDEHGQLQEKHNHKQNEEECACCLEGLSIVRRCTLPCGHSFHFDCIYGWLKINSTCALCRKSFPGGSHLISIPEHGEHGDEEHAHERASEHVDHNDDAFENEHEEFEFDEDHEDEFENEQEEDEPEDDDGFEIEHEADWLVDELEGEFGHRVDDEPEVYHDLECEHEADDEFEDEIGHQLDCEYEDDDDLVDEVDHDLECEYEDYVGYEGGVDLEDYVECGEHDDNIDAEHDDEIDEDVLGNDIEDEDDEAEE